MRSVARQRSRGLALLVVLWAGALLSVVAASFTFAMRTEAGITINLVERAKAEALAEAGVFRAIVALTTRDRTARWATDGRVHAVGLGGGQMRISVLSEKGKIDLNRAPPALMEGLVGSLADVSTLPGGQSRRLAHAVLDWRDRDDKVRPEGAEASHYEAAGLPNVPQNRAFLSVAELNQVLGMTDTVFRQLESLVTVHSFSSRIDPATAPRRVLLAVPGLDAESVDEFLALRSAQQQQAEASGAERPPKLPLELLQAGRRYLSRAKSNVYTVVSEGRTPAGVAVTRKAIVRVTRSKRRPYVILAWGEGVLPSRALAPAGENSDAGEADDEPS